MRISYLIIFCLILSCAPQPGNIKYVPKNRSQEIQHLIKVSPKWFIELPKSGNNIYASATALSEDYQSSIKKAVLIAKVELADKINGKISAKEEISNYEKIVEGKLKSGSQINFQSTNIVDEQIVDGYEIMNTLTLPEGNSFRTFVLLKK